MTSIEELEIDSGISKGKIGTTEGEWVCTDDDCKNINFARRTHCNRCNKERVLDAAAKKKLSTEIGKAAAEKSRGLFSAEDWQCSKCANVNWARRSTCNMCNAPRFTDVEERTGFAGGYNDRGVVEYKEREDSDGEFDEFGRRKKMRISSRKTEPQPYKSRDDSPKKLPESVLNVKDDDDEEDEDEDDEGDLSKYALFDSDTEADRVKQNEKNNLTKRSKSPTSSTSSSSSSSTSSTSSSGSIKKKLDRSRSRSKTRSNTSKNSSCQRSRSHSRTKSRSRHRSRSQNRTDSRNISRRRTRSRSRSHSSTNSHSRRRSGSRNHNSQKSSRRRSRSRSLKNYSHSPRYSKRRQSFSKSRSRSNTPTKLSATHKDRKKL